MSVSFCVTNNLTAIFEISFRQILEGVSSSLKFFNFFKYIFRSYIFVTQSYTDIFIFKIRFLPLKTQFIKLTLISYFTLPW